MADDAGPPNTFELVAQEIDIILTTTGTYQQRCNGRTYLRGYLRGMRDAGAINHDQWILLKKYATKKFVRLTLERIGL